MTSNQTLGYLCVTCHYISESWKIHKKIIKFNLVETPHDGWNLFNTMLETLQYWHLESKLFAITLDNASVNNNFVTTLKENLVSKGQLLRKGKLFHCRCATHVFNLIVQEGFEAISSATKNIRESVRYVKSSQARKQRFELMVEKCSIPVERRPLLDVVTRWNSTYHMLVTSLKYRRAYEALRQNDPQYIHEPSTEDWKLAKKLCTLLEPLYDATMKVSGSNYPTSIHYFHQILEVKKDLEKEASNSELVIRTMVHEMKQKLKKYWDLSYLNICIPIILDPRFKLKFLEFRLKEGFGIEAFRYLSKVEMTFRKLFAEYSLKVGDSVIAEEHTVSNVELNELDPWADWAQHQSAQRKKKLMSWISTWKKKQCL